MITFIQSGSPWTPARMDASSLARATELTLLQFVRSSPREILALICSAE